MRDAFRSPQTGQFHLLWQGQGFHLRQDALHQLVSQQCLAGCILVVCMAAAASGRRHGGQFLLDAPPRSIDGHQLFKGGYGWCTIGFGKGIVQTGTGWISRVNGPQGFGIPTVFGHIFGGCCGSIALGSRWFHGYFLTQFLFGNALLGRGFLGGTTHHTGSTTARASLAFAAQALGGKHGSSRGGGRMNRGGIAVQGIMPQSRTTLGPTKVVFGRTRCNGRSARDQLVGIVPTIVTVLSASFTLTPNIVVRIIGTPPSLFGRGGQGSGTGPTGLLFRTSLFAAGRIVMTGTRQGGRRGQECGGS